MHEQLMSKDREYVIVRFAILSALPKGYFRQESEDKHNRWFEVLCKKRVQYNDIPTKKA